MAAHRAYVEGIGLWSPRLAGWEIAGATLRGGREPPAPVTTRPAAALLPPTERRRAPDAVVLALEVAASACAMARRDPQTLASVFASTYGDPAISDYMCATLAQDGALISPIKFHNSVHNAPAGYWTIATGATAPYTALTAYRHTFGTALLSALAQVASDAVPVLCVAYDSETTGPIATMAPSRGQLALALVLAPEPSATSRARLSWRVRTGEVREGAPRPANAALAAGNAIASCLALAEALADGTPRELVLSLAPRLALEVSLEPAGGPQGQA